MFKYLFNWHLGQKNNTNILNECQEDYDYLVERFRNNIAMGRCDVFGC